jgi:hypothetical protein
MPQSTPPFTRARIRSLGAHQSAGDRNLLNLPDRSLYCRQKETDEKLQYRQQDCSDASLPNQEITSVDIAFHCFTPYLGLCPLPKTFVPALTTQSEKKKTAVP